MLAKTDITDNEPVEPWRFITMADGHAGGTLSRLQVPAVERLKRGVAEERRIAESISTTYVIG